MDYWQSSGRRRNKRKMLYEEEKVIVQRRHQESLNKLKKKFDYYCSKCLYQTNEYSDPCPKCGRGRLVRTTR